MILSEVLTATTATDAWLRYLTWWFLAMLAVAVLARCVGGREA